MRYLVLEMQLLFPYQTIFLLVFKIDLSINISFQFIRFKHQVELGFKKVPFAQLQLMRPKIQKMVEVQSDIPPEGIHPMGALSMLQVYQTTYAIMFCFSTLQILKKEQVSTRRCPLRWCILGVLTHTTPQNRHFGGDKTLN